MSGYPNKYYEEHDDDDDVRRWRRRRRWPRRIAKESLKVCRFLCAVLYENWNRLELIRLLQNPLAPAIVDSPNSRSPLSPFNSHFIGRLMLSLSHSWCTFVCCCRTRYGTKQPTPLKSLDSTRATGLIVFIRLPLILLLRNFFPRDPLFPILLHSPIDSFPPPCLYIHTYICMCVLYILSFCFCSFIFYIYFFFLFLYF